MPTQTANYQLSKPLVDDPTDQDLWGGEVNSDLDMLDSLLLTAITWQPVNITGNFNVIAPAAASTGSSKILYLCNSSSAAFTVFLPTASSCAGMVLGFKKTDNSNNQVSINPAAGSAIDGNTSYIIISNQSYVFLECDGTNWNITGNSSPRYSLAFNGSEKNAIGKVDQWGIVTGLNVAAGIGTTSVVTVTFTDAFTAAPFDISASSANGVVFATTSAYTATNFQLTICNVSAVAQSNITVRWRAVGA